MPLTDAITPHKNGVSIDLHISSGATHTRIQGYNPWRKRIEIHINAPAHKGAANRELTHTLAGLFNTNPQNITIQTGTTTNKKTIKIHNIQPDTVIKTLEKHIKQQQ